jgi:putative redox protein
MTIRMYARRKNWPLDHVSVDVSHDKTHAEDCTDCPDKSAKIDVFRRVVRLDGPLDAGQRSRLMEIADRCPVHRTFEGMIKVETTSAET